ncbi:hypothetical protein Cfor_07059, partial [Coptotermes formosanus]
MECEKNCRLSFCYCCVHNFSLMTVEKSSNIADRNFSSLKVESERLEKHSQRACKCWIWVMVAVVIIIFI